MNKDEIIRMAREADEEMQGCWLAYEREFIEAFAALVEKEVKREASFDRADLWLGRMNDAVKQEREECADLCESHIAYPSSLYFADTIRARSNT